MTGKKSINFTVVPYEPEGTDGGAKEDSEQVYANFCAVSHTPFDFTLTFCRMSPLSDQDVSDLPEGATQKISAPVKVKVVIPSGLVPALGAALQENWRIYQEAYSNVGWTKGRMEGKVH